MPPYPIRRNEANAMELYLSAEEASEHGSKAEEELYTKLE